MSHDGNGNTNLIGSAGFAYTAENLLGIGGGRYFQSDGEGRTRYVHTPDWSSYRAMVHAGTEIIHEAGSGGLNRRYVHGAGVDEPLVSYDGTNLATRHWLHADERGSIVAQSDGTGAATSINRYDDYGAPASTNTGLFQYTGRPYIPEIGMYDYRARVYNPGSMGSPRFMQPDPIGYRAGMNLYGYVGGDPVNFSDPSGLGPLDCPVGTQPGSGGCVDPSNAIVVEGSLLNFGRRGSFGPTTYYRGGGGGGGGGIQPEVEEIIVTYQRRIYRPSLCVLDRAGEFFSNQGEHSFDFRGIEFRELLDSDAAPVTRDAYYSNDNGAVTQRSIIYVHPRNWETYTNPFNAEHWHEIRHTQQFYQYGRVGFYLSYGFSSMVATATGGNIHDDNAWEREANDWGQQMARFYALHPCAS